MNEVIVDTNSIILSRNLHHFEPKIQHGSGLRSNDGWNKSG